MELVCRFFLFAGLFAIVFRPSIGIRWSICVWAFPGKGLGVDFDGGAWWIPPDGYREANRAAARRFHTLPVFTGAGKIWVICRRCPCGSAGRGRLPDRLFYGKPGGHFPPGHGLCFLGFQRRNISGRRVSGPVKIAARMSGCPSFLWKDAAFDLFSGERPVFCHFAHGTPGFSMDARSQVCSKYSLFY